MNQYQFQAPSLSTTNKLIIVSVAVIFVINAILSAIGAGSLFSILALSPQGMKNFFFFQILTYPLIEIRPMGLIFNLLIVWFLGSEIERDLGKTSYRVLLGTSLLVTGLVYALFATFFLSGLGASALYGLTGLNFILCVAYAYFYPDRQMLFMFIFPLKSKYFCLLLAAIEFYFAVFGGHYIAAWAHLLCMGSAFFMLRFGLLNSLVSRVHDFKEDSLSHQRQKNIKKSYLKLIKDEEKPGKKDPKYWQ